MPAFTPHFSRRRLGEKGVEVRLGHPLLDDYLRFVAARCRPNSVLAAGYDLKVFFAFIGKDPVDVTTADMFEFIASQRFPVNGDNVIRIDDGEKGLSARTIAAHNSCNAPQDRTMSGVLVTRSCAIMG